MEPERKPFSTLEFQNGPYLWCKDIYFRERNVSKFEGVGYQKP